MDIIDSIFRYTLVFFVLIVVIFLTFYYDSFSKRVAVCNEVDPDSQMCKYYNRSNNKINNFATLLYNIAIVVVICVTFYIFLWIITGK